MVVFVPVEPRILCGACEPGDLRVGPPRGGQQHDPCRPAARMSRQTRLWDRQVTQGSQAGPDASHARVAAALVVDRLDHHREPLVRDRAVAWTTETPGVVARAGHLQLGAHEHHRVGPQVRPVRYGSKLHCLSFANQVATFFAKSTCIDNCAFSDLASLSSARSRTSSTRSDSSNSASGAVAASFASRVFFTHLPNVISCTSILRATSAIDRWSSMTKVTAFALYSSVKLRRVEPILSSPD